MVFTETIDLTLSPAQIPSNQEKQRRSRISIALFSELPKPKINTVMIIALPNFQGHFLCGVFLTMSR